MIRRIAAGLGIALLACAAAGRAEVFVFKNGDRVRGDWTRIQDGKLMMKSENLGEVTVPLSSLQAFSTDGEVVVMTKRGVTLRGTLSLLTPGVWELRAANESKIIPAVEVRAAYPAQVYESKAPARAARPWQYWRGGTSAGYSAVQGDRRSHTLFLGFNATRREPELPGFSERFRTNFFSTALFANTETPTTPRESANSFSVGLRQDFLFTPTNFIFVLGQADHVEAQKLNLRQRYGAGLGHDLIHGPRVSLGLLGGATYLKEQFMSSPTSRNSEALVGWKFGVRLAKRVSFDHQLNFYPSLTDSGQYRGDTVSTLTTRISSHFALSTTFMDRYLSNPLPGLRKSESVVTSGLNFNF